MKKIVTFTATWCGPCKMLKPILQQLQDDKLIVWENYDIDENKKWAEQNNIKSVPTSIFYGEDGNVTARKAGFLPREEILKLYSPKDVVAEIIESSEHFIKKDDVIVEAIELVEQEPFVKDDEPNESVIEDLEAMIAEDTLFTPPHIDETFELVDVDQVYDDEFSDEDLGNDLPETIDPDDLF